MTPGNQDDLNLDEELSKKIADLEKRTEDFQTPKAPDVDSLTESKLKEIEEKAQAARKVHESHKPGANSSKMLAGGGSSERALGMGMAAGGGLIAGPVLFYLIGVGIDHYLGSNIAPIMMFLGLALGMAYVLVVLQKANR